MARERSENLKKCPWKQKSVREESVKSVRESDFLWKNSKKGQKNVSRTLLVFTQEKKTLPDRTHGPIHRTRSESLRGPQPLIA